MFSPPSAWSLVSPGRSSPSCGPSRFLRGFINYTFASLGLVPTTHRESRPARVTWIDRPYGAGIGPGRHIDDVAGVKSWLNGRLNGRCCPLLSLCRVYTAEFAWGPRRYTAESTWSSAHRNPLKKNRAYQKAARLF